MNFGDGVSTGSDSDRVGVPKNRPQISQITQIN